jgi:GNAT superfamily N-acetyltransferase
MSAPQDPVLRAATPADADRIAQLLTDEGYPAGPSDVVERLDRLVERDGDVVVADVGGDVLGFVAVHRFPRFEHDDQVVRILALLVDPGVRERGVGRLLMDAAEQIARDAGAAFLEVTAGHHRPGARQLFESLGYDAGLTTYLRRRL